VEPAGHDKVIRRVDPARHGNPALQERLNLRFYRAESDSILFDGKMAPARAA
jgi:hypothetical protein